MNFARPMLFSAFGAFIGGSLALQSKSDYWSMWALVSGAVSYLVYDPVAVLNAIAIVWKEHLTTKAFWQNVGAVAKWFLWPANFFVAAIPIAMAIGWLFRRPYDEPIAYPVAVLVVVCTMMSLGGSVFLMAIWEKEKEFFLVEGVVKTPSRVFWHIFLRYNVLSLYLIWSWLGPLRLGQHLKKEMWPDIVEMWREIRKLCTTFYRLIRSDDRTLAALCVALGTCTAKFEGDRWIGALTAAALFAGTKLVFGIKPRQAKTN